MGDKREITKLEKQIINDIMSRSNYNQEKATEIAKAMIDFGYTIHEQDYYRLKKENKELRKAIKQWNISGGNLLRENAKLKKALDKACERLEYYTDNCPCGEELIEDLDCDDCESNCKECWKKYFMKEVLENETNKMVF